MICMNLDELTIHRKENRNNFIDLLSVSPIIPHIKIEGSVSSSDIPEINEMFCRGPIYLMTKAEAEEYLELKREKEVETKEEESNEEHN